MKRNIYVTLCFLLALSMLIAVAGCDKKAPVGSESEDGFDVGEWDGDELGEGNQDGDGDESGDSVSGSNNSKSSTSKSSTSKSSTSTSSKGTSAKNLEPLKYDLKGKTITIVSASGNPFPTTGSTATKKAMAERTAQLKKDLNCKIEVRETTGENISAEIYSKVLNGEKYADILYMPIYQAIGYIAGKVVVPFDSINSLDLTSSYMNPANMYVNTSIKGNHYLLATEDMLADMSMGIYFNKRIMKEVFGNENHVYDLVKNNTWTISKLEEMAQKATKKLTGSGAMTKDDQWGLIARDRVAASADAYFFASGGQMISNSNNTLTFVLDDPKNYGIIDKIKKFYTDSKTVYTGGEARDGLVKMFTTGHSLFYSGLIDDAAGVSAMKDDFGFVPFPRGDNASSYSGTVNWNRSVFMLPEGLSAQAKEDSGALLQAYGYLSGSVCDALYQELDDRYFRDDKSLEMVKTNKNAMQFRIENILGGNYWTIRTGTYGAFFDCIPGKTPTKTYVEQKSSATKTAIKDFLSKIK